MPRFHGGTFAFCDEAGRNWSDRLESWLAVCCRVLACVDCFVVINTACWTGDVSYRMSSGNTSPPRRRWFGSSTLSSVSDTDDTRSRFAGTGSSEQRHSAFALIDHSHVLQTSESRAVTTDIFSPSRTTGTNSGLCCFT